MGLMCICSCADRWKYSHPQFKLNRKSNEQMVQLAMYPGGKMWFVVGWIVCRVEDHVVNFYFASNKPQNKAQDDGVGSALERLEVPRMNVSLEIPHSRRALVACMNPTNPRKCGESNANICGWLC